jgi:hypothetical protein
LAGYKACTKLRFWMIPKALESGIMRPSGVGAPALLAFAAHAGAFAALGGQDVGVAGVAPAQVGVQMPAQRGATLVIGSGDHEGAQRPKCASIGLAQDA